MRVLIAGADGQLGWELQRLAPSNVELVATDTEQLDITQEACVEALVATRQPDVIINAAAYTAVDKAESDVDTAYAVNRDGVANLARAAQKHNIRLIQISTDFIFDGSQSSPYDTDVQAHPLGVYGDSKWQGENAVKEIMGDKTLLLRTSWVYSSHGTNFVKTMLRLMAEKSQLGVIADQVGTPTWAGGLARAIWSIVEQPALVGTFHWTDAGVASWYDFALAIQEEGINIGLLSKKIKINPLNTKEYPTPAARPPYSVLDKTSTWSALDVECMHWREALKLMLAELAEQ